MTTGDSNIIRIAVASSRSRRHSSIQVRRSLVHTSVMLRLVPAMMDSISSRTVLVTIVIAVEEVAEQEEVEEGEVITRTVEVAVEVGGTGDDQPPPIVRIFERMSPQIDCNQFAKILKSIDTY